MLGCGKSSLVEVAAKTMNVRIVSLSGGMNNISQEELIHNLANVFDTDRITFGDHRPSLVLLVWS